MKKNINNKIWIYSSFFILSILIGIIVLDLRPDLMMRDGTRYNQIAQGLVNNHEYIAVYGHITYPGYPFFLAIIYKIFGYNIFAVFFIQSILLGLIASLVFYIARRFLHLNYLFSYLAGLLITLWPYLILYSVLIMTEVLFIVLLLLFIIRYLIFKESPNVKNAVIMAIILTIAVLIRPIPLLLLPWIIILSSLIKWKYKDFYFDKNIFKKYIIAFLFFIFLLSPWIAFSSYKIDRFVPVGSNIYAILNKVNKSYLYERQVFETKGYEEDTEITLQKIVLVKLKNSYRFWKSGIEGYHAEAVIEKYSATKYLIFIYRVFYFLIIGLGFLSLFFLKKNKNILNLWIILLYFWAFHTAMHTHPRFTLPIIPIIIMFAVFSLSEIKNLILKK